MDIHFQEARRPQLNSTQEDLSKPHCNEAIEVRESQVLIAHTCNPSYLGGWDLKGSASKPPWTKRVHKTPSQPVTGCNGTHLSSQATWEAEIGKTSHVLFIHWKNCLWKYPCYWQFLLTNHDTTERGKAIRNSHGTTKTPECPKQSSGKRAKLRAPQYFISRYTHGSMAAIKTDA
jgi:hypothetical protein